MWQRSVPMGCLSVARPMSQLKEGLLSRRSAGAVRPVSRLLERSLEAGDVEGGGTFYGPGLVADGSLVAASIASSLRLVLTPRLLYRLLIENRYFTRTSSSLECVVSTPGVDPGM